MAVIAPRSNCDLMKVKWPRKGIDIEMLGSFAKELKMSVKGKARG